MAQKYVFVRMPVQTYERYFQIRQQMQHDLSHIAGKPIKIPMTKVFKAIASPEFNENFIQINLKKMLGFVKNR